MTETEDYIAHVKGNRTYPWRILAITEKDTEMPVNNLVYALASPNRIGDCSWVKPGKVAWDWWNDWNLKGYLSKQVSIWIHISIILILLPGTGWNMSYWTKVGMTRRAGIC